MDKLVTVLLVGVLAGACGYLIGIHSAESDCRANIEKAAKMNQALRAQLAFKEYT